MNIKFVDIQRQNNKYRKEFLLAFKRVFDEASYTFGPYMEKFEKSFAKYCGKKYAVGVNSGVDGLKLSLIGYGIKEGDEVITVPNSYFGTSMVISNINAVPVFVDIDPTTYTIDVSKIEKAITKKTKAIIPVHLYGQPAQMDVILAIAKKYNLIVIEDACQAHGSRFNNKTVPFGETGVFSFYPGKNLGGFGDGGIIVTDNANLAQQLLYLRNDGSKEKYIHPMFGHKSRLDTIHASVLLEKLKYLDSWNEMRRKHAQTYTTLLQNIPGVTTPQEVKDAYHVYHIYTIECKDRDKLRSYLLKNGIEVNIHYPIPIHLQEAYKQQGYTAGMFPITEEKAKRILSLPIFPELTEKEIEFVCKKIKDFFD